MLQFEFHDYGPEGSQTVADITRHQVRNEAAAKARAGRQARRNNSVIDVALAGSGAWELRYVTTVAPSEHHAAGYRFERLK